MHRFNAIRESCSVLLFVLVAGPCFSQLEVDSWLESTTWTDITGKFKIEATFVRIDNQSVVLKKSDGKEISVPLNKLNEESRKRAAETAKKRSPASSVSPMKSASPVSNTSTASSSSASIAIPSNLDAEQFVDFLLQHAKEGRMIVLWDAMPTKYQNDLNGIVKLAAEKVDPSLVKPVLNIGSDLVKVLRTKKNFILNTPTVKGVLVDERLANTCYEPMVDLVEAYLPNELLDQAQLKKGDLRPILDRYMTRVAQKAKALEASVPKDSPAYGMVKSANWESFQYDVESSSSNSATLVVKREGSPEQRLELVSIEGRWLPKQMVDGWDKNMGQAKQELGKLTPQAMAQAKQGMQMPMMMIGGAVNGFLQANDQASFDQAVGSVMSMIPMAGGMPMPGMQPGMPMPGLQPPAQ